MPSWTGRSGHASLVVLAGLVGLLGLAGTGCTAPDEPSDADPSSSAPVRPSGPPGATSDPTVDGTDPAATAAPPVRPGDLDVRSAVRAVRHLAGRIGPRPATGPAFARAAAWVEDELVALGWDVRRQRFDVPGGVSWGVPVPAGTSVNLVATRGTVRPGRPWLLVGAHLDTVPQAPGAEDNASGVGVLLAVAEALRGRRGRLPVTLVAFGAEEPRGPTDDDHHYGSRAYVAGLTAAERRHLRGMVSLDRVGVGDVLPVGSVAEPSPLRAELLAAARRAGVQTQPETAQRSSDHWSFVRDGLPGVRLGGTSYAAYHSPADVPSVIDADQLERTGRTVLAWLRPAR